MRKFLIAGAVTLAALAVPAEASAKGAASLTISSFGRSWEADELLPAIADQSHFYDTLWEPSTYAFSASEWTPPGTSARGS